MIIACHAILSAYGFWLPNDPRGSWSDFVRSWELFRYGGPATAVNNRCSHASAPHDREARLRAKEALKYPPVTFDGLQARAVARGFADAVRRTSAIVRACAILKDHVHMVILRHRYSFEKLLTQLKGGATRQLIAEEQHPLAQFRTPPGKIPSPWAQLGWIVYIDDAAHLRAAINYVRNNPLKEGLKAQNWNFCREVKVN